eukprot:5868801-Prymnesium_polylepis.1
MCRVAPPQATEKVMHGFRGPTFQRVLPAGEVRRDVNRRSQPSLLAQLPLGGLHHSLPDLNVALGHLVHAPVALPYQEHLARRCAVDVPHEADASRDIGPLDGSHSRPASLHWRVEGLRAGVHDHQRYGHAGVVEALGLEAPEPKRAAARASGPEPPACARGEWRPPSRAPRVACKRRRSTARALGGHPCRPPQASRCRTGGSVRPHRSTRAR